MELAERGDPMEWFQKNNGPLNGLSVNFGSNRSVRMLSNIHLVMVSLIEIWRVKMFSSIKIQMQRLQTSVLKNTVQMKNN